MYRDQFGEFVCGCWGLKGQIVLYNNCKKKQYLADMCFIASTYSFSLSVNSFLADKEKIVSIESLSWREVAKTWPMTEKK